MNVIITDAAREDVATAIRWYNSKPSQYGADVAREFEAAIRSIKQNPRLHPLVEDGPAGMEIREVLTPRFQQRVIFREEADSVVVIGMLHSSSRPGAWHSRLDPT